jgi:hypothetical protein
MQYSREEELGRIVFKRELHLGLEDQHIAEVPPGLGELVDVSLGRLFIEYCRLLDAQAFTPPRRAGGFDKLMGHWLTRIGSFSAIYLQEIIEVFDWLARAARENHPWLANKDDQGRPKKLMKCATIEALYAESVKCLSRLPVPPMPTHDIVLGEFDEKHVCELTGGYTLVEMLSPEALDLESVRMRHCVGHGNYDAKLLESFGYHLYSVRTGDGEPVATIETANRTINCVLHREVRQLMGPRNRRPAEAVIAAVEAAMPSLRWIYPAGRQSVVPGGRDPDILVRRRL